MIITPGGGGRVVSEKKKEIKRRTRGVVSRHDDLSTGILLHYNVLP